MDIQENPFTEALLDDIESHPCIAAASRDIDDAWENFLNQASCHFHPELEALVDDLGLEPIEEDDVLPF